MLSLESGDFDAIVEDFEVVRSEMRKYDPELDERPFFVAGNKLDEVPEEFVPELTAQLSDYFETKGVSFMTLSALTEEGIPELVKRVTKFTADHPRPESSVRLYALEEKPLEKMPNRKRMKIQIISMHGGGYRVLHYKLEKAVERYDFSQEENVARFTKLLRRYKVEELLEAAGAQPGDLVSIGYKDFQLLPRITIPKRHTTKSPSRSLRNSRTAAKRTKMNNRAAESPDGIKIGIMGGTFDPIHYGHLLAADEAHAAFGLSEVIFIPSGHPPHKANKKLTSPEDRYLMTELATVDCPYFRVSRVEIDRQGSSYTIDTLRALRGDAGIRRRAVLFHNGARRGARHRLVEKSRRDNDDVPLRRGQPLRIFAEENGRAPGRAQNKNNPAGDSVARDIEHGAQRAREKRQKHPLHGASGGGEVHKKKISVQKQHGGIGLEAFDNENDNTRRPARIHSGGGRRGGAPLHGMELKGRDADRRG